MNNHSFLSTKEVWVGHIEEIVLNRFLTNAKSVFLHILTF